MTPTSIEAIDNSLQCPPTCKCLVREQMPLCTSPTVFNQGASVCSTCLHDLVCHETVRFAL